MNDFKRNDRFGGKRSGGVFGKREFNRPAGGGFSRPQGPSYQAVCAQCGKTCEVPFRPDGQRPIYCRECFRGTQDSAAPSREDTRPAYQSAPRWRAPVPMPATAPTMRPAPQTPDPRIDDLMRHVAKMQLKLDKILLELAVKTAQSGVVSDAAPKKKPSRKK